MRSNKRKYYRYALLCPVSAVVFILIFGAGIYRYHWEGRAVRVMAAVLPYPAILVDWEVVRYSAYLSELQALTNYWRAQQANANVFVAIPSEQEIREELIVKLADEKAIQIWARKHSLAISGAEVKAEWEKIAGSGSTKEEINKFLAESYGWNENKFKRRVLRPYLLREKVRQAAMSETLDQAEFLEERAQKIYAAAQAEGADFAELARSASEDENSAHLGGDLGYFGRGVLEPGLETLLFSMAPGDISQPSRASSGYHIFKLEDALHNDEGNVVQVRARHIFIKGFDFDEWLKEQRETFSVYRLI